jgi:radical SAM protein with 4Fe4S-binding SPASM domain
MACFGFARGVWEKIGYTPEEYLEFWKNSINYMLELNRKGIMMRDGMATILLKKIFTGDNAFFAEMNAPCGAVTGQMVYNYNGDIFPCDEARVFPEFKLGNVRENTRKEVISHPTACSMINISSNLSLLCDSCAGSPSAPCPLRLFL